MIHLTAKGMESQMDFASPHGIQYQREFNNFASHVHQSGMCLFFFRYGHGFKIGFGMQELEIAG